MQPVVLLCFCFFSHIYSNTSYQFKPNRFQSIPANMNNNNQGNQGGEDYLDKALDKVEQMAGKKVCAQTHPGKQDRQN